MGVLEESVEVANAMVKLRTSEFKILELRTRCHPSDFSETGVTASVRAETGHEDTSQPAMSGTEEVGNGSHEKLDAIGQSHTDNSREKSETDTREDQKA